MHVNYQGICKWATLGLENGQAGIGIEGVGSQPINCLSWHAHQPPLLKKTGALLDIFIRDGQNAGI